MRIRFGDCTFDGETRELERGRRQVHLSPKAFRLLELLLESRPKALSKSDLQERIWPDTFVAESNLASLAAEVRGAIGDESRSPRFLRTVYGFGYAFAGDAVSVGPDSPAAGRRHCLTAAGREVDLLPGENVVGRDPAAAVRIDDPTVSRHHARIVVEEDACLEDLDSKNGTFLEGKPVHRRTRLKSGAILKFGSVLMTFRTFSPVETTESARRK